MAEQAGWSYVERLWTAHGFVCLCALHDMGHRTGYVIIQDKNHPMYGKDYHEAPVSALDAHGGITYADFMPGQSWEDRRPKSQPHYDGVPDGWLIGIDFMHFQDRPDFDAARAIDPSPSQTQSRRIMERAMLHSGGHLWTTEEVVQEVTNLALLISVLTTTPEYAGDLLK